MIRRARFRNYKALRDVSIEFEPFTVIVGPNSSGKSSILEGLQVMCTLGRQRFWEIFDEELSPSVLLSSFRTDLRLSLEISGHWEGHTGRLGIAFEEPPTRGDGIAYTDDDGQRLTYPWHVEMEASWDREPILPARHFHRSHRALTNWLGSAIALRPSPRALASPSYLEGPYARLERDGFGLPSVLNEMAACEPERFEQLQEITRQTVPGFRRVRTRRAEIQREEEEVVQIDGRSVTRRATRRYWGHELLIDFAGARGVPAHAASEGTLLILGLLASLMGPNPSKLLLLDDFERGLHPRTMEKLLGHLRRVLDQDDDLQLIAATHSPSLVDHFHPEEVLITSVDEFGTAMCAPLTEHMEFAHWKQDMQPGELWEVFGDSWVQDHPDDLSPDSETSPSDPTPTRARTPGDELANDPDNTGKSTDAGGSQTVAWERRSSHSESSPSDEHYTDDETALLELDRLGLAANLSEASDFIEEVEEIEEGERIEESESPLTQEIDLDRASLARLFAHQGTIHERAREITSPDARSEGDDFVSDIFVRESTRTTASPLSAQTSSIEDDGDIDDRESSPLDAPAPSSWINKR